MILVQQNDDKYEIRFGYNTSIIELVKNVPGRMWNPEGKFWSIPKARLGFLIAQFKGTQFEKELQIKSDEDLNVNASIDEPNVVPDIDVSDVNWYVADGCQVFEHQKDTVRFAKWRYLNGLKSGFILADEPGCIYGGDYVWIKLPGDQYPKKTSLSTAYRLFSEGVPLYIKSYVNSGFHYMPVAAVLDKGVKEVITLRTTYQEITCTPDHFLLSNVGWLEAQQVKIGDELITTSGLAKVIQISPNKRNENVYDITIGDVDTHNYVVNSFVCHNCGKTLSVTEWAMYMKEHCKAKHCLIVACVNSAKYNWREDIIKHTKGEEIPYLLGTRRKRDGSLRLDTGSKEKLEDLQSLKMYGKGDEDLPFFLIMNIEALHMKSGKRYAIADRLIELINAGEIDMIALDEVHRNCSAHAVQGRQLLRVKKESKKQIQWIPMTGTPITSRPTDVFIPLRLVDGHNSNSYYNWCQEYCVYGGFGDHEIVGYKNIPKLKNLLQPNMLRRLKKDILDLPPKIHNTEYVDNTAYQAKLYEAVVSDMQNNRDSIMRALNPMTKFLRLRQVNGSPELVDTTCDPDAPGYLSKNARLTRLLELLDDILSDPDEKVVVFSNWVEPLRTLHKFISKRYKVCCYTGTMSAEEREKHKSAFINNPERRVMLGTIGALGTSHTLTVARNVIFYDSPWNPADIEQAEDRCHRPGTKDTVFVYTLVTIDTVDEKVHQILSNKEGTAQYIVDNELDLRRHPELFDLLLKH